MHIESLKIYCDVVDRRSFSRAADDNGISQSTASQAVHHLEKRLDALLLDRSKRPFVLTPEGERFYEGCRRIVREYEELEQDVRSLHNESARRLVVASIYSVGLAHMSAFMRQFSAKYPSAQVRLDYMHPDRVYEAVESGDVDLGLVSYPEDSRDVTTIPWRSEPIVLVCHPQHRLAGEQSISLTELSGEPLIAFESGLRIRSEIDRALMLNKVEVKLSMEFDNIETMKRAVEINEGVSLLPLPTVARETAAQTLTKVSLNGVQLTRPLGIIHRRDHELNELARQFVESLQTESDITGHNGQIPTLPINQPREELISQQD